MNKGKKIVTIITLLLVAAITTQAQTKQASKGDFRLESNLPVIYISCDNYINAEKKVDASMRLEILKGKYPKFSNYEGKIRIKLRGNSSLSFNQKKFTIDTRDENGKKKDVSLLGMPAEHDWVLLAPYVDVSMIRDPLAFKLWEEMGYWAPHCQMVEVVLNNEYQGIYVFTEKIKHDVNRMDIASLKPEDNSGREVTGGYLLRIDTYDDEDITFESKVPGIGFGLFNTKVIWTCLYPSKKDITPEQLEYIHNYIDSTELCIQSANFNDKVNGYRKYINVSSFVDYFIHTELTLNADAYKRSAYFYKTKQNEDGTGGKLHAGTVWDYNLAFGNCNFCGADDVNAWAFEGCNTSPTPAFWKRLLQDQSFRDNIAERYQELRKTVLSEKHIDKIIDDYAKLLSTSQKRHFEKYPELLRSKDEDKEENHSQDWFQNGTFPWGMGFPMMGGPMQGQANGENNDSTKTNQATVPQGFGMPFMGFPQMGEGGFPQMPEGGFPQMGAMPFMMFPPMGEGGFPQMGEGGFPQMGEGGFPQMGEMPMMSMPMMGMGGMNSWFTAYSVSSYEEEIKYLKNWIHERLQVMDETFGK